MAVAGQLYLIYSAQVLFYLIITMPFIRKKYVDAEKGRMRMFERKREDTAGA
jgi:hypothetical protein